MQNGIVAKPMLNPIKDPIIRSSGTHFKFSELFWFENWLDLISWPHLGPGRWMWGRGRGSPWWGSWPVRRWSREVVCRLCPPGPAILKVECEVAWRLPAVTYCLWRGAGPLRRWRCRCRGPRCSPQSRTRSRSGSLFHVAQRQEEENIQRLSRK